MSAISSLLPTARWRSARRGPRRHRPVALLVAVALISGLFGGIATAQTPAGPVRIDLEVLVIDDGGTSVGAIVDAMEREGVPFTTVRTDDAARPTIDADFLSDAAATPRRGRFQAVVVPNENVAVQTTEEPGGLTAAEITALATYRRDFGIRQVNAYVYPSSAVGLASPTYAGPMDGAVADVTAAGRAGSFRYLAGEVPFDVGSYGYVATPLPGVTFETLVEVTVPGQAGTGSLIGAYTDSDGLEELVITASSNDFQLHSRALAHGIIGWATKGVHLGAQRNYFSVHIDDVFLPDDRWSIEGNCTPYSDCPLGPDGEPLYQTEPIRMNAADAEFLRSWQQRTGLKLDLAYNGFGSQEAIARDGADPLSAALLAAPSDFRWINHTWSHPWLGCNRDFTVVPWRCATAADGSISWVSEDVIAAEIAENRRWATANNVPINASELVTGQHSGLMGALQPVDNPNLGPALARAGIRSIASDNSLEQTQRPIGPALTVPRYPMNIFYNVATEAEEVDEYNWIYTSEANGGSGICERFPETTTCIQPLDPATGFDTYIAPLEASIALGHVLGNDPRPHFVHQSNLAEERILYPVLDQVVDRYRSMFAATAPMVQPTMTEAAEVFARQDAWRDLLATSPDAVQAYTLDGDLRIETTRDSVEVPVTAPLGTTLNGSAIGEAYGGERSGWVRVTADATTPPTTTPTTTPAPTPPTTAPPTPRPKPPAPTPVDRFCANVPAGHDPFDDVRDASTFARTIRCLEYTGITRGLRDRVFGPSGTVTRAQMASFLVRKINTAVALDLETGAALNPLPAYDGTNDFTDVEADGEHAENINILAQAGIALGGPGALPDSSFAPLQSVSREQMASFVTRSLEHLTGAERSVADDYFADDETSVHQANINALAAAGIAVGNGADRYGPGKSVTREQMSAFIMRSLANLEIAGVIAPFPVPSATPADVDGAAAAVTP